MRTAALWQHAGIPTLLLHTMRARNFPALGRHLALPLFLIGAAALPLSARALSACSSDGMAPPRVLVERFINADCEDCWAQPTVRSPDDAAAVVLDWIVPSTRGDDAPLSAAALPEAQERLRAVGRTRPARSDAAITDLPAQPSTNSLATPHLRVAQGPALNGYLGITLRLTTPRAPEGASRHEFTLLLVESIPAQEEGSPVARNMVRNVLRRPLVKREQLSKREQTSTWDEIGVMGVPEGANTGRLRLVGWVETAQGQVLAAAQSLCQP